MVPWVDGINPRFAPAPFILRHTHLLQVWFKPGGIVRMGQQNLSRKNYRPSWNPGTHSAPGGSCSGTHRAPEDLGARGILPTKRLRWWKKGHPFFSWLTLNENPSQKEGKKGATGQLGRCSPLGGTLSMLALMCGLIPAREIQGDRKLFVPATYMSAEFGVFFTASAKQGSI